MSSCKSWIFINLFLLNIFTKISLPSFNLFSDLFFSRTAILSALYSACRTYYVASLCCALRLPIRNWALCAHLLSFQFDVTSHILNIFSKISSAFFDVRFVLMIISPPDPFFKPIHFQCTLSLPPGNNRKPNAPFLYPMKTAENLTVFCCFQGVDKECIGNKWVKFFSVTSSFISFF